MAAKGTYVALGLALVVVGCGSDNTGKLDVASHVEAVQNCGDPPDLLIVFDRSGSMGSYGKWGDGKTAVQSLVTAFDGQIRFGLELFPSSGSCTVSSPQVGVGDSTGGAIVGTLNSTSPGGNTPIVGAVNTARSYLTGIDPDKDKYVMLVTDGQPTCTPTDDASSVNAVAGLAGAGIKTFVIGFGSGVDAGLLGQMAVAGQTGQYYQANNAAELQATFAAIASFISCCGNGTLDPGEECDDGNNVGGDGCSSNCTIDNVAPVALCQDVAVPADAQCQACASVDNGSYDPNGTPITMAPEPACPYSLGETLVTLTVSDGVYSAQCSGTVQVSDETAPAIGCPEDMSLECVNGVATATFDPTVSDNCPGASVGCLFASGSEFALGETVNECVATDGASNQASCSFAIDVQDTRAPSFTVQDAVTELWPPNHKYYDFELADCVTDVVDECEGSLDVNLAGRILRITSDELEDDKLLNGGQGDGDTCEDIIITGNTTAQLLSERMGGSDGRVYRVFFEVADASGNAAPGSCQLVVPHDQGTATSAVEQSCAYCVGEGCGSCQGPDPACGQ